MFGSPEAKARMWAAYPWIVLTGYADESPSGKYGSYTDEQWRYTPFNMKTNGAGPTFRSWTEAQRWTDIARRGTAIQDAFKTVLLRLQS
jgi:hypothetical protein